MTNPFEAARSKAREALANTVIKALNQKGYEAVYAPTKEDALAEILNYQIGRASCRERV